MKSIKMCPVWKSRKFSYVFFLLFDFCWRMGYTCANIKLGQYVAGNVLCCQSMPQKSYFIVWFWFMSKAYFIARFQFSRFFFHLFLRCFHFANDELNLIPEQYAFINVITMKSNWFEFFFLPPELIELNWVQSVWERRCKKKSQNVISNDELRNEKKEKKL